MTEDIGVSQKVSNPTQLLQSQLDTQRALYQELLQHNGAILSTVEEIDSHLYHNFVKVKIEDINMPFVAVIGLMVKIALASIPAFIILAILIVILWVVYTVFLPAFFATFF